MAEPNYKVIELSLENDKLKDEIILLQKQQIKDLEERLSKYEPGNVHYETREDEEVDVGSNMIDQRLRIRTTSELVSLLEQKASKRKIEDSSNA